MKVFIPINLDLELLLSEHPVLFEGFRRDHMVYILSLINMIPALNKDIVIRNGFVPINAKILQSIVPSYRKYLDYLLEHKVLITDKHYIVGKKSIGYKFAPLYEVDIAEVELSSKSFIKRVQKHSRINLQKRQKYKHLLQWYTSDLSIHRDAALQFVEEDYNKKKCNSNLWNRNRKTLKLKDPFRQYRSAKVSIQKIAAGDFSLSIDENVNRLHSTLSNMRSDLRKFLFFAYRGLASVDISNCQPYLSLLLLRSSFWTIKEGLNMLTIVNSYKEIFKDSNYYSSFVMLCKRAETCTNSDVHLYQTLVKNGEFYEYLTAAMEKELGLEITDRKEVKALVFQVLFTDNRFIGQEDAAPKRVFKKLFPTVYELFSLIKKNDKATLPLLLQRIESHMVLQVITKRISKEQKELPIFTLHDSIITTIGNEAYVKQVIEQEFIMVMGVAPSLKVEYWSNANKDCIRA